MIRIDFIDLFAGIGGFRLGMQQAGHTPVGWCEKDKFAQKSYRAIHDTKGEWFSDDIRTVNPDELPEFDVLCGGFPCQSFSVAGNRGGFEDTRGTLFFEIARIAKARNPKYLFLENVRGLLSHDGGRTFGTILNTLHDLGYSVEWQVLNSKDFGVPQNRERVFIIGHIGGKRRSKVFPIRRKTEGTLKKVIDGNQSDRVDSIRGTARTLASNAGGGGAKTSLYITHGKPRTREQSTCIDANYHKGLDNHGARTGVLESIIFEERCDEGARTFKGGVCGTIRATNSGGDKRVLEARACLTPNRLNKRQNGRRFKEPGEPSFTLTKSDIHGVAVPGWITSPDEINRTIRKGGRGSLSDKHNWDAVYDGYRIRKLTPKECFRLQGFLDSAFEKAQEVNSDTQLYRQAGNSVTVPVVYEIAKRLEEG